MPDLDITESTLYVTLADESTMKTAAVNDDSNVLVIDTPTTGVSTIITLTTTAVELKVGGSALLNRRLIEMQALDKNVKWGYNSNCEFDLFKNQFFSLPCGESCTIFLKASTGTADIAVAEKA